MLAGRQAEAEESYRKALAVAEPLARENPAVSEFQMTASQVLDDLGHLLARDGRRDAEARRLLRDGPQEGERPHGRRLRRLQPCL